MATKEKFPMTLLLILFAEYAHGSWNSEDLVLYDLVEEVNENFYEIFGTSKDASLQEIKKSYRKLSLQWHPDRNNALDAENRFRQIVAIYEVLKSEESREKYNNILEFGLPDWRQPIYYYRKMRKFTWYEAILVLLGVSTIAHYFMMWATYYEKYLVVSQNQRKSKKREKKIEKTETDTTIIRDILAQYRPRCADLLPVLLTKLCWELFTLSLTLISDHLKKDDQIEELPDELVSRRRITLVRQPEFECAVATDLRPVSTNDPELEKKYRTEAKESERKHLGVGWTCEELSLLIRLSTEKYPPGTPNRWEHMARMLNRNSADVVAMAGKLKQMKQEEYVKLVSGQQSTSIKDPVSSSHESADVEWTQNEQVLLETALQRFPKGCIDRWDKISEIVGTKSKEQCINRFKHIIELVKRRKTSVT